MPNRFSAWRAFFLLIGALVLPALACDFSVSTASITNGVMAKDVQGDKLEPVDVTVTYSVDQAKFHAVVTVANAPSDTLVKATWFAVDVGSAAAPNTLITETEVKVEGSRNVDFTLTPSGNGWPPGAYKVDIYLNSKLDRTLVFTVQAPKVQPTVVPTKPSSLATGCPSLPSVSAKPSGIVASVTLAQDIKGDLKEPVNPTVVFKPESIFHAVTAIQNAPANSKFAATWFATDVGSAAPCNTKLDSAEIVTNGSGNIDFSISPPPTKWPVGTYRVEIMVNGVLDRIVSFSVSASSSGQPTAAPPTQAKPTAAPPTQAKPTAAPPTQAKPTVPPTPAGLTCGNGVLDPGMVGVYVTNNFDGELLFAIASRSYKIPGHSTLLVQVPGGKPFTYSATITGVGTLTAGPYTFDPGTCVPFTPQN